MYQFSTGREEFGAEVVETRGAGELSARRCLRAWDYAFPI